MTTTTTNELTNGTNGRWLGQRGIYRHHQPDVEDVIRQSAAKPGEGIDHVMSTAVSAGTVVGELIRQVYDDEVGYIAEINGTAEHGGLSDVVAYSLDNIAALTKVANDLRYEWEQITGRHKGVTWSVL